MLIIYLFITVNLFIACLLSFFKYLTRCCFVLFSLFLFLSLSLSLSVSVSLLLSFTFVPFVLSAICLFYLFLSTLQCTRILNSPSLNVIHIVTRSDRLTSPLLIAFSCKSPLRFQKKTFQQNCQHAICDQHQIDK